MISFEEELRKLINQWSKENESNTPDFILAQFMAYSLDIFNKMIKERDEWYNVHLEPGHEYFITRPSTPPEILEKIKSSLPPSELEKWKSLAEKSFFAYRVTAHKESEEEAMREWEKQLALEGLSRVSPPTGCSVFAAETCEARSKPIPDIIGGDSVGVVDMEDVEKAR